MRLHLRGPHPGAPGRQAGSELNRISNGANQRSDLARSSISEFTRIFSGVPGVCLGPRRARSPGPRGPDFGAPPAHYDGNPSWVALRAGF